MHTLKRLIDTTFYSFWLSISLFLIVGLFLGQWSAHANLAANTIKALVVVLPWLCLFTQFKGFWAGYLLAQAAFLALLVAACVRYAIDYDVVQAAPLIVLAGFHALVVVLSLSTKHDHRR